MRDDMALNEALRLLGYAMGFIAGLKYHTHEDTHQKIEEAYIYLSQEVDRILSDN